MQRPDIRYSRDGVSIMVRYPGDEYWYRFDHPVVDTVEYGAKFRCLPRTFAADDPYWLDAAAPSTRSEGPAPT